MSIICRRFYSSIMWHRFAESAYFLFNKMKSPAEIIHQVLLLLLFYYYTYYIKKLYWRLLTSFLEPRQQCANIVPRGLRSAPNRANIMPRDECLSDKRCNFCSSLASNMYYMKKVFVKSFNKRNCSCFQYVIHEGSIPEN